MKGQLFTLDVIWYMFLVIMQSYCDLEVIFVRKQGLVMYLSMLAFILCLHVLVVMQFQHNVQVVNY
jgi:hypothetical protein